MVINVFHVLTQERIRWRSFQPQFIKSQTTLPLHAHDNVYQCMCMISDVLIDNGGITLSLALGCGKKRLQDKPYTFVTEERTCTFRTSQINSSRQALRTLTWQFLCKSSLFCLWLFLGMSCCYRSSLRLSMPFSGFALKWCLKMTTMMRGNIYTHSAIIAVRDIRIVVRLIGTVHSNQNNLLLYVW